MNEMNSSVVKDLVRLARRGLAFLIICIGTYLLLLFILTHIKVTGNPIIYRASQGLVQKGGFTYERFREFNPDSRHDILAFGSSRVNRGIDPRVFEDAGYSIYNLGTDDQTPLNTKVLIEQYVKPGKCRLVILDIFDKIFSQGSLESSADLIQNLNDDNAALQVAMAADDVRAINLLGIRMMLKNQAPSYKGDTKLYKGYRVKRNQKNDFTGDTYAYKTNKQNLRDFDAIIKYLKSVNIPFLLVCQPIPSHINHENHRLLLKDIDPILKANNVSLHDYSDDATIVSYSDFADESHLNSWGAEIYSKHLLNTLVSKEIQPLKVEKF